MEQEPLVRPVDGGRPHEAILAQVEHLLTSGRLRPGDRLPSERDLAEQLGVSRPTVREAMRTLEALGVTTPASTIGRGAASVVVTRPGEAMGAVLRLAVATSDLPVDDVVDLRVVLEREAVGRLAAGPAPDLDEVTELLDLMDAPGLSPAEFHRLDAGLHVALARAAGNRAVEVVMTSLRAAIEHYVLRSVPDLQDWEAVTVRLRAEHRSVVEAVADRDPVSATQRVEDHIRGFHALTGAATGVGRRADGTRMSAASGAVEDDLGGLVDRARALAVPDRRHVLGITGPPGVGKSHLAAALVDALGPDAAVLVPMDGFHLSNATLRAWDRRSRKGAWDTFDAEGYVHLLRRLRANEDEVVHAPDFDRVHDESIGSALPVHRQVPLVVTEGNYLLLDRGPWVAVRELLDECWYLEASEEVRSTRLVARHEEHGMGHEDAVAWAAGTDGPNAELIRSTRSLADQVVRLVG